MHKTNHRTDSRTLSSPIAESIRFSQNQNRDKGNKQSDKLNSLFNQRFIKQIAGKTMVMTCVNCNTLKQSVAFQADLIASLQNKIKSIQTLSKPSPSQQRESSRKKQLEILATIQQSYHQNEFDHPSPRQNHHQETFNNPNRKFSLKVRSLQKRNKALLLQQHLMSLQPQSHQSYTTSAHKPKLISWLPDRHKSRSLELAHGIPPQPSISYQRYMQDSSVQEDPAQNGVQAPKLKLKQYNCNTRINHGESQPEKSQSQQRKLRNPRNSSNSPKSLSFSKGRDSKFDTIQGVDLTIYSNDSIEIINKLDTSCNVTTSLLTSFEGNPRKAGQKKLQQNHLQQRLDFILHKVRHILQHYKTMQKGWEQKEIKYINQIAQLTSIIKNKQ